MTGGSLAERRDRHQRRGAHDWRSLTNPAAISSPSGASHSRLGGQVRLDAGAAVFPQAVQAVAVCGGSCALGGSGGRVVVSVVGRSRPRMSEGGPCAVRSRSRSEPVCAVNESGRETGRSVGDIKPHSQKSSRILRSRRPPHASATGSCHPPQVQCRESGRIERRPSPHRWLPATPMRSAPERHPEAAFAEPCSLVSWGPSHSSALRCPVEIP